MLGRTIAGFALAPLPVVGPITLMFAVIIAGAPNDAMSAATIWLELVAIIYCATLIVGVPVHFALTWLRRSKLRSYLAATTFLVGAGFLAAAVAQSLMPSSPDQNPFRFIVLSGSGVASLLVFEALALSGASIFWVVSVRPRRRGSTGASQADH